MDIFSFLIEFTLHIDKHLGEIIQTYGTLTYAILFLIIFVETGLVFFPFLPGDSLLFAAGALAAIGPLNVFILYVLLFVAAVLGDTINYWIGYFFGQRIIHDPRIPLDAKHLEKTYQFFEKHGGKTIILARFLPFARTFAPFVAGVVKMEYKKFFSYNVIGGFLWVTIALFAGYFFGNILFVKKNFSLVIIAIILISVIPVMLEVIAHKKKQPNKNK
jgi:membrane-associated protein